MYNVKFSKRKTKHYLMKKTIYNRFFSILYTKNKKKRNEKSNLVDYFTFDDFNPFERVNLFSVVVNFRC